MSNNQIVILSLNIEMQERFRQCCVKLLDLEKTPVNEASCRIIRCKVPHAERIRKDCT